MNARYTTADEIDSIVANGISESINLDFKQALPGTSDGQRKEFLADVSSFANAVGGHLIFGVEEESGIAKKICGVAGLDDQIVLRLDSMIRDGIAPRITVKPCIVDHPNGQVLVIAIPRSWARPHMVTFGDSRKFHSRGASGKFTMDVAQLRAAFSEAEVAGKRIRDFRLDRLARITAGEVPYPILKGPTIALHLAPLAEDPYRPRFDVTELERSTDINPLTGGRYGARFNFDGIVTFMREDSKNAGYLQVFRSGAIEAVDSNMLSTNDHRKLIPSTGLEDDLIAALPRLLRTQREIGAECPVVAMVSLIGVRGFELAVNPRLRSPWQRTAIDRDDLLIAEVVIESWDAEPATTLRPILDSIWQATGWPRSMNYDEQGRWVKT